MSEYAAPTPVFACRVHRDLGGGRVLFELIGELPTPGGAKDGRV